MKSRFIALAGVSVVALMLGAQGSAHSKTTAPPPVVDIRVTITDKGIAMVPARAQRGDYARFILRNLGRQSHTFTFGTGRSRGTGLQTGFTKAMKPNDEKILLLFLDYRGKVPFGGSLPSDRGKPGMKGFFTIS